MITWQRFIWANVFLFFGRDGNDCVTVSVHIGTNVVATTFDGSLRQSQCRSSERLRSYIRPSVSVQPTPDTGTNNCSVDIGSDFPILMWRLTIWSVHCVLDPWICIWKMPTMFSAAPAARDHQWYRRVSVQSSNWAGHELPYSVGEPMDLVPKQYQSNWNKKTQS